MIRDGKLIGTLPAAGPPKTDIASMMVGREVLLRLEHTPATPGDEVLRVDDLIVVDDRGVIAVDHLSLTVRAARSSASPASRATASPSSPRPSPACTRPTAAPSAARTGRHRATVRRRRDLGLAYIPEDRHDVGTAPRLSVAENIAATHLRPPLATTGGGSQHRHDEGLAQSLIAKFDVRGAHPDTVIGRCRAATCRRSIIAREFESDLDVLLVSQPTRGVDVGAMEFVHNSLVAARDRGAGVLLISADLNEVMSLSDRLLVVYRGRIIAEFTQDTMSEVAVGLAMAGVGRGRGRRRPGRATPPAGRRANWPRPPTPRRWRPRWPTCSNGPAARTPTRSPASASRPVAVVPADRVPRLTPQRLLRTAFAERRCSRLMVAIGSRSGAVPSSSRLGVNPLAAYSALFVLGLAHPSGIGRILGQTFVPLC